MTRPMMGDEGVPQYYVYVMANHSRTLYIGITSDLHRRVHEHKHGLPPGFTGKYRMTQLVYYATFTHPRDAIAREKQLKGWRRSKKIALMEPENPLLG